MSVVKVPQAKELGLEIPNDYNLRSLSSQRLVIDDTLGWFATTRDRRGNFSICFTAQARNRNRQEIDNEIIELQEEYSANISELLVDGAVIQWLFEKYEAQEESEKVATSKRQEKFMEWISAAIDMKASDVHFVENGDTSTVIFRVNGLPLEYHVDSTQTVDRIVEAGMNLSKNRQGNPSRFKIEDLSIPIEVNGEAITLRLSKTGAEPGRHVVCRIIRLGIAPDFKQLRLPIEVARTFDQAAKKPDGCIVMCAPTNHGKSETLAAIIDALDDERLVQIISDPIERLFPRKGPRLVQKEVSKSDPNRSHTALFHAALRQDQDVTSIAEMRDQETCKRVYEAALGGRLMITTYHAKNPFSAFTRLINDGLDPLVLAEQSLCFSSQRLLPELCPDCRVATSVEGVYMRNKKGCSRKDCVHGAVNRRVTAEALMITSEYEEFIATGDIKGLEQKAIANGYVRMQQDVRRLVMDGAVCPFDSENIVSDVFSRDWLSALLPEDHVA